MGKDWDVFLDAIQVFGGAYIIFIGFDMKRTGVLTQYSLIGKNVVLSQAPDIPGFIEAMYRKYIICGILFLIPGLIGLYLNSKGLLDNTTYFILTGILAADLIVFAYFLLKAQKRYLVS
ncbi:MAG: hypothetical protein Q4D81_04545 [Eubacteriales bacterium]|nr:hypothetical protein [Eubacteriales bacterium]